MKKVLITSFLITFLLVSCQENRDISPTVNSINQPLTNLSDEPMHRGKITDSNLDRLHEKVSNFSEILKNMYSDNEVVNEVNDFIQTGFYSDENVIIADLLYPEKSPYIRNARISMVGKFKNSFKNESTKQFTKSAQLRTSGDDLSNYLIENGVAIYFPYSERHFGKKYDEITIVMPPKEDVNESDGIRLRKCGTKICEENVRVNDEYAMQHPTHIIYAGGADTKKKYENGLKKARIKSINSIYVGAVRCNRQYDALISFTGNGGGSEIKFFRGSGYLSFDTNNQITNITGDIASADFSRSEISNCNLKVINSIWDLDWKTDNFEQVFGIYEEDTKGEISFTGTT